MMATMLPPEATFRAWLGFAPAVIGANRCVRICAWCHDAKHADDEAVRLGFDRTHTMCAACVERWNLEREAIHGDAGNPTFSGKNDD
jgi:hypothetical protein